MLRTTQLLLAALVLTSACATTAPSDPRVSVRAAETDGAITRYELVLDHAERVVWVIEREDGERGVLVASTSGDPLVAVRSDGDGLVELDIAAMQRDDAELECDGSCPATDAISAELIELVLDDALPEPTGWRVASSVEKKHADANQAVIDKLG